MDAPRSGPSSFSNIMSATHAHAPPSHRRPSPLHAISASPPDRRCYIDNAHLGDRAILELSGALGDGCLASLIFLDLNGNQIGDPGLAALSVAIGRGALGNLTTLYLHANQIGNDGTAALAVIISPAAASAPATAAMPKLERLWLHSNRIGNHGCDALAAALASGGLAALKSLQIETNPASEDRLQGKRVRHSNRRAGPPWGLSHS